MSDLEKINLHFKKKIGTTASKEDLQNLKTEFFGKESDDIFPDRFIEVKGTTGKKFSIFWSGNEIEKAKELGTEYWIYSVTEIDLSTDLEKYAKEPEMIPDPYSKIRPFDENHPNDEYLKEQEKKFRVTKND